uniref:Uncharacterized protein n=1 Tax=Cacopsylla melanoneura TaxID=428564 RepID=A0A8D8Z7R9_9HEMI
MFTPDFFPLKLKCQRLCLCTRRCIYNIYIYIHKENNAKYSWVFNYLFINGKYIGQYYVIQSIPTIIMPLCSSHSKCTYYASCVNQTINTQETQKGIIVQSIDVLKLFGTVQPTY